MSEKPMIPEAGSGAADLDEEFVCLATFLFPDEAAVALGAVRSARIPCYLQNDRTLTILWGWNFALGGIRLMVPESSAESARLIFNTAGLDEDPFDSGEEVAIPESERRHPLGFAGRGLLALCILLSPTVNSLKLLILLKH